MSSLYWNCMFNGNVINMLCNMALRLLELRHQFLLSTYWLLFVAIINASSHIWRSICFYSKAQKNTERDLVNITETAILNMIWIYIYYIITSYTIEQSIESFFYNTSMCASCYLKTINLHFFLCYCLSRCKGKLVKFLKPW